MAAAGEINRRLYAVLLLVYPAAFRQEFGQEMIEVFCEQIQDSSRREGWKGAAGVWYCVGSELFRTALSSHLDLVGISLVSILSSLGIFCTFFWFIFGRH